MSRRIGFNRFTPDIGKVLRGFQGAYRAVITIVLFDAPEPKAFNI